MSRLAKLTLTEAKLFWRDPTAWFFALAFPSLLLVILGSIPAFREPDADLGGLRVIDLYAPIIVGFVLAMLAISVLPSYLATYREKGILRRLSTTPVQPSSLLQAQLAMGLAMALSAVALVIGIGAVAFDTALPTQPLGFLAAFGLAAAALYAVGLMIAAVAPSGKAAAGIGTVLWFPIMFFAGLWVPREAMPDTLNRIGDFTPLGAGVQAMQDAWNGAWPDPLHLAVMAAFAIGASLAAARLFRWE
ncbi:MAG TPA: ABC transporter permease [Actinomycetota bacterium]|nr:ABC transporter permease [Actinomycetota bacterium]